MELYSKYFYTDLKLAVSAIDFDCEGKKIFRGEDGIDQCYHSLILYAGEPVLVSAKTFCETEWMQEIGLKGDSIDPDYNPTRKSIIELYIDQFPYESKSWDIKW